MSAEIVAAQSASIEPEGFQSALIENMAQTLLRQPSPPCLLRAPTGSGKTFVLSRVLAQVSLQQPVLWLWFVPFVNLVQQTEDALAANAAGLATAGLGSGRNREPQAGLVLLSTAQGVARARDRTKGYDADGDDDQRTMAAYVARTRGKGLRIGLVVDEAHIGLDHGTEFGKFAAWLKADFLIMATATPRDDRLMEFVQQAGLSAYESFAASRDEVVAARLNKRYIEAVVYDLRQSVQTIADLKRTVLRQAWKRHVRLKKQLSAAKVTVTPLLLVQVANGEKTVEEAEKDLMQLCKVPPAVIGKHSSDEPDPVLMAAIANDSSKEVLIFKQSAGTGFDAPRAFVLASTKAVNDADFAMQFIGRVMRVSRAIRAAYPKPAPIPDEFDTAYIYLADAEAQTGFESAVRATQGVKSQLEGQTETLVARQMASGAVVYTNHMTPQAQLGYDFPLPPTVLPVADPAAPVRAAPGTQQTLFGGALTPEDDTALDEMLPQPAAPKAGRVLQKTQDLDGWLEERGLRAYRLRRDLPALPHCFKTERRPEMESMSKVSETVAARLELPDELARSAVRAALSRLKEKEVHTELTEGTRTEEDVLVVTDRAALAREALAALRQIPQVEEQDSTIIVRVLAQRLLPRIDEEFESADEEQKPAEADRQRFARDAALWVIRRESAQIAELLQGLIAEFTTLVEADPLPDAMTFPAGLALKSSRRNTYGVMPPSDEELVKADGLLLLDVREAWKDARMSLQDGELRLGRFDNGTKLNGEERAFAEALDRVDFVAWWHRNPDRKAYAVRLVRGEHQNYFYPDFVVALAHYEGDAPLMRLLETKQDVKDASRKARRIPRHYGKVLFLTKDQSRLRVVNDDGSLGLKLDWDDLTPLRTWFEKSRPVSADT